MASTLSLLRPSLTTGLRTSLAQDTHGGFINFAGLLWEGPDFAASGPTLGRPENWNSVMGQMAQLSGWQIPNNVAWGVYASDNNPPTYQGIVSTKSVYVKNLTASDFDADGNLKDFALVRYGARWYSDGQQGWPVGSAVTQSGNTFTIHLSDLITDYFPWAVSGNGWLSCNRPGGGLYRWTGSWSDMKNSIQISRSHVFHQQNGWQVSPKTGAE